MRLKIIEAPNETPIVCVLIVLGLLSCLATFLVTGMQFESFLVTTMAGLICSIFALPLGLRIASIPPPVFPTGLPYPRHVSS